ncbi:MAG: tetratricopeptide repeat protein [Cyanobacteria bacterium]|nr:tetratricopeptide repeat protein [Cyanobacteriota bacterium]
MARVISVGLVLLLNLSYPSADALGWSKKKNPSENQTGETNTSDKKPTLEKQNTPDQPPTSKEYYEKGLELFRVAQLQSEKGNTNGQKTLLKEAIKSFEQSIQLEKKQISLCEAEERKAKKVKPSSTRSNKEKEDTSFNRDKNQKISVTKDSGELLPASEETVQENENEHHGTVSSSAQASSACTVEALKKSNKIIIESQSNIGFVYLTLRQYNDAVKNFQIVLDLNPHHLNTLNGLANAYALENKIDEAIKTFDQLTQLDPGNPQFFFNKGSVLQKAGQTAEAQLAYQEALRLDPQDQRTLFNMGTLFENKGLYEDAKPFYQKAKNIAIGNQIGLEALRRIEKIDKTLAEKPTENPKDLLPEDDTSPKNPSMSKESSSPSSSPKE